MPRDADVTVRQSDSFVIDRAMLAVDVKGSFDCCLCKKGFIGARTYYEHMCTHIESPLLSLTPTLIPSKITLDV